MEHWKAVKDYEGYYEVSNLGNVRRLQQASGTQAGKTLKPILVYYEDRRKNPYPCLLVSLSRESKVRRFRVSRLVAEAFIGPSNGMQVNHKDGNSMNNAWFNLEYVTNRGNSLHASCCGLLVCGEEHAGAKVTESQIREIRTLAAQGWTMRALAAKYGLTVGTIHPIVHRKTWKHVV